MKSRTTLITTCILGAILFVGGCIYFVSGVSATSPPIKEYQCIDDTNKLVSKIRKFCDGHSGVHFDITDKTGTPENGFALYGTVSMIVENDSLEYNLKFENRDSRTYNSTVKVILAYDKSRNIGGYSKDATHVKELMDQLNSTFLIPLEKDQKTKFISF